MFNNSKFLSALENGKYGGMRVVVFPEQRSPGVKGETTETKGRPYWKYQFVEEVSGFASRAQVLIDSDGAEMSIEGEFTARGFAYFSQAWQAATEPVGKVIEPGSRSFIGMDANKPIPFQ